MTIRSKRLELRPLDARDVEFVKSLYADGRVTRTLLRIQGQITLKQASEYCQVPTTSDGEHRFGARLQTDGRLIAVGSVRWRAEQSDVASIGYSVVPAFWGRGYGTEVAALLVEFAAGRLGAREIRATTLDDNRASARVLEKVGFTTAEAGASEIDSRGDERRVTRWVLHRQAGEPRCAADRLDAGRPA